MFIISLLPLKKQLKINTDKSIKIKNIYNKEFTGITSNPIQLYWITRILSHFNILNHWIMHNSLNQSINLYRYFDKGLLQFIGPFGIFRYLNFASFNIEMYYTGFIIHYGVLLLIGLLLI
jgi:hypothetical protein